VLKERGQPLSPTAVREVLKAEGFARLPRRLDEERPDLLRPTIESVADVREFSLAPRKFTTECGGLFLFLADLVRLNMKAMGKDAVRLWGMDRYETSVQVANYMGGSEEIFIATGEDFPDALSIGPIAAVKSAPILLTEGASLPGCVKQYIDTHIINKIYVIGGTDVISNDVTSGLSNVERITGNGRYERNINIIDKFSSGTSIVSLGTVCIATGENFPDALSGSAFSAPIKSPVILVSENLSDYTKNYVKDKLSIIDKVYVFGGTGAVSDSVVNSLFK
jgi:putative cell wall-binding protein